MHFDLKRPCADCPFRLDHTGYLRAMRAKEIGEDLLQSDWHWFACHETTDTERIQQCAGSLLFLLHQDSINVPSRIAAATGMLDLEALDRSVPVASSVAEFVSHHCGSNKPRD